MLYRIWPSLLVVLALLMLVTAPAMAALDMLEGTVIAADEGKLIMQDQDGKRMHTLDIASEVKVTRDGREARLENLMAGDWAKITTEKRLPVQTVVVAIDARSSK
jgi:hypothetical protein